MKSMLRQALFDPGLDALDFGKASIMDAQNLARRCEEVIKNAGYIMALFGSTLREGAGHDIDLLVVPLVTQPVPVTNLLSALDDVGLGLCLTEQERHKNVIVRTARGPDRRTGHPVHMTIWGFE